jgi:hypothetical protein
MLEDEPAELLLPCPVLEDEPAELLLFSELELLLPLPVLEDESEIAEELLNDELTPSLLLPPFPT